MDETKCSQCGQLTTRGDFCSQMCEGQFIEQDSAGVVLLRQWMGEVYALQKRNLEYLPGLSKNEPEYRALKMLKGLMEI